jgi:hypothetical protein
MCLQFGGLKNPPDESNEKRGCSQLSLSLRSLVAAELKLHIHQHFTFDALPR